jgi:hypothetical protein
MARYVSLELAGLIRLRAYAGGALTKAEKRTKYLREQLQIAETERQAAVSNIADLDAQLTKYRSIDPADIRPIVSKPRRLDLHHGEFSAELIWLLREMKAPVSTQEIIAHVTDVFSIPMTTLADRERLRRKVTKRLQVMAKKGAIQPLHKLQDNQMGLWLWIDQGQPDQSKIKRKYKKRNKVAGGKTARRNISEV